MFPLLVGISHVPLGIFDHQRVTQTVWNVLCRTNTLSFLLSGSLWYSNMASWNIPYKLMFSWGNRLHMGQDVRDIWFPEAPTSHHRTFSSALSHTLPPNFCHGSKKWPATLAKYRKTYNFLCKPQNHCTNFGKIPHILPSGQFLMETNLPTPICQGLC